MLDLKALRRDPDAARTALARRGGNDAETFDRVLVLDERRREILPQLESLRAEQNAANQAIAQAKKAAKESGDSTAAEPLRYVRVPRRPAVRGDDGGGAPRAALTPRETHAPRGGRHKKAAGAAAEMWPVHPR